MSSFLDRHPWAPFVLAFVLLLGAWTTLIVIAIKNSPVPVPLEHLQSATPSPRQAPPVCH